MMTLSDIVSHRLYQQYLSRPTFTSPQEVVSWMGAVQAQDYGGGKWAVAQRTRWLTSTAVDEAFAKGELLRTHVLRPTWHFVTPQDLRWMLALTAPRINRAMGHYYRQNELDDVLFARCNALFAKALVGKQLTKAELGQVLATAGIVADMGRLGLILLRAELDQVVVSGAWQGKQQTFALFEERVPAAPERKRDESLADLALRYFTSHGPATLKDFSWWSGLTMGDARNGVELVKAQLTEAVIEEQSYWFREATISPPSATPMVHLLPNYDEYLVAYVERTAPYPQELQAHPNAPENVLFVHTILINGQVVGTWKATIKKQAVMIQPTFLRDLSDKEMEAYHAAVGRYGAYLGVEVMV